MIVTQITLGKNQLVMASHQVQGNVGNKTDNAASDEPQASPCSAKLVALSWLNHSTWHDVIDRTRLAQQYGLHPDDFIQVAEDKLTQNDPEQALLRLTIQQLQEYQQGERQVFDVPLDVSVGTVFQQQVWQALQRIPYGQAISYAQLAANIDNPKAYRAVGNANGRNPIAIIIPCHRVLASAGKLGGYTGGLENKEMLLAIEKITVAK